MRVRLFKVACCAAGLAIAGAPVCARAADAAVSGVVRDRAGIPQIDALVELLRPDFSVAALAHTDAHGAFTLSNLVPGAYLLRATETSFLPALRENVRVFAHQHNTANITLSTLFEATEWLPAERRPASEPEDDWRWTLRASTNRPLLRFTDEGPVTVSASDFAPDANDPAQSSTAMRVQTQSGGRVFGQGGLSSGIALARDRAEADRLVIRADAHAAGGAEPAMDAVVATQQSLGSGRTVRTALAYTRLPQIVNGGAPGFDAVMVRSAESADFGPLSAAFGAEMEAVRGATEQAGEFPFASLTWRTESGALSYRIATASDAQHAEALADPDTLIPNATQQNGRIRIEHGLHQELRWTSAPSHGMRAMLAVYDDRIVNPVLSGGGTSASFAQEEAGNLLMDPVSGVWRATGPQFGGAGTWAQIEAPVAPWISVIAAYAAGPAIYLEAQDDLPAHLQRTLTAAKGRTAQAVTLAATGKARTLGSQWRASYRWQPPDSLTPVDLFDIGAESAYLSLFLRQPIHVGRVLPDGMEALFDIRNLLAQGYRPFLTADGGALFFAQTDRSVQGGIAFTF